MSKKLTEEEKGKARVIAIMCGLPVPAWAAEEKEKLPEENGQTNKKAGEISK